MQWTPAVMLLTSVSSMCSNAASYAAALHHSPPSSRALSSAAAVSVSAKHRNTHVDCMHAFHAGAV
jgi:hypothetical protein